MRAVKPLAEPLKQRPENALLIATLSPTSRFWLARRFDESAGGLGRVLFAWDGMCRGVRQLERRREWRAERLEPRRRHGRERRSRIERARRRGANDRWGRCDERRRSVTRR